MAVVLTPSYDGDPSQACPITLAGLFPTTGPTDPTRGVDAQVVHIGSQVTLGPP